MFVHVVFQKVLVAPAPLRIRVCRNYIEIRDVLKTIETPMVLHGFDVLDDLVCVFVLLTTLFSIHDLRWTFLVSRGRFTFS